MKSTVGSCLSLGLLAGLVSGAPHHPPHTAPTWGHPGAGKASPGWGPHGSGAAPPAGSHPGAGALHQCAAGLDGKVPSPAPPDFEFSGQVRRYYIAAEEVLWDYAPSGWDNWLGLPLELSPRAQSAGVLDYGTTWLKALYRGYTDETFTTYSPQPSWQGTQGPTIRSEVGDLIEIMFVNKLSQNYATLHSMGLEYNKVSEGSTYPNNTAPGQNVTLPPSDAVPPMDHGVSPGDCVVYKWMVNAASGPGPNEPATIHSYHSYVSLQQDADAGLIGPQIVYAAGQMQHTMATYREFPILYMPYVESDSWLSAQNKQALNSTASNSSSAPSMPDFSDLPSGNRSVWYPQLVNYEGAGKFSDAPSFYAINGYVYANNPVYEMCLNDRVIWYLNAYGTASHVFHMHGNSFTYNGQSNYAINIAEGVGKTLYMNATGAGLWQFVCHVDDHLTDGMLSNYRVYSGECPLRA